MWYPFHLGPMAVEAITVCIETYKHLQTQAYQGSQHMECIKIIIMMMIMIMTILIIIIVTDKDDMIIVVAVVTIIIIMLTKIKFVHICIPSPFD
jgi:hypothetical protein